MTGPSADSTPIAEENKALREIAELRRPNEILKAAAIFFGAELDRPGRRRRGHRHCRWTPHARRPPDHRAQLVARSSVRALVAAGADLLGSLGFDKRLHPGTDQRGEHRPGTADFRASNWASKAG